MKTCPIPGCSARCGEDQVCCRKHWFSIPKDLRERIWNEYRSSPGSREHLSAVAEGLRQAALRDRTALSASDFWSALEDELDAQADGLRPRCIRMSKDLAIELVRSTPPLFREGPQLLRSSDTGETYWHTFTAQERTAETLERLKREEMPIRSVMTARYGDVPCRLDLALALTSGFTIEWARSTADESKGW